jgi:site-specific recombinase XerD
MIKTNYYLEKRKDKNGILIIQNMPIYLFASFEGQRLQYYAGERCDLKNWDEKRQRIKGSVPGSLEVNGLLDKLEADACRIYREARIMGQPLSMPEMKARIAGKTLIVKQKILIEYYQEFLDTNRHVAKSTFKKMTTVLHHLSSFSESKKVQLRFENMTDIFFSDFVQYSISPLNHTNNTIHRHLGIIRWFLRWTIKKGYNAAVAVPEFKFRETETEIIALTQQELTKLINMKLPSIKLEHVRDAFCLSCLTSLRYSDLKNLKKSDIHGDHAIVTTIKTKSQVYIPLAEDAIKIINKYSDTPTPYAIPVVSNQKMNDYLKEIGGLAEINQPITIIRYQGSERIEKTYPKYELISTHVGRKTFISLAFEKGARSEIIRQVSGHKNPKVFDRYNRITPKTVDAEIRKVFS